MLLGLAAAILALAPGTAPAGSSATVVLMPFENLSGAPAAPAEVAAAVVKRIEGLGYRVVHGEPVETYLTAERIRYLDSLSSAARQKLLRNFEASGVLLGTIYSFAEGDNPIVGISARMLREDGSASWAGVAGLSADDTQGLLGVGRVGALSPLADKAVSTLLRRFPAPGGSAKMAGAQAKPLDVPAPTTYRSARLAPGTRHLICILPLENRTTARVAPRVVGELLSQRLAASEEFRVVESDDFRKAMVAAKIRGLNAGDPEQLQKLATALGTSLFLQGTIYRYREASPRNASITPELELLLTLVDSRGGRVLWTAHVSRKGTDYMGLLELGAISSVVTLSDQLASEIASAFEHTKGRGRRAVTVTLVASDKTYDGSDGATIASCTVSGAPSADAAALQCSAASAAFSDPSAGSGKTVTANGLTLSGAAASRYVLDASAATTTASIRPKPVAATVTASDKTYDGATAAAITSCKLTGVLPADSTAVECAAENASFADPKAGPDKTVTARIALSGSAARNYAPSPSVATAAATIRRRPVTAEVTVAPKTYNGTTAATIAACALPGVLAADRDGVACRIGGAAFEDAGAGAARPVRVTGVALSGAASENYALTKTTLEAAADVAPKPVAASVVGGQKIYDGTPSAPIASCALAGVLETDSGRVGCEGSGMLADKSVGTGKPVTATVALTGEAAGNYALSSPQAATTATIAPRPLTAEAVVALEKTYDGTTAARLDLGAATLPDAVPGDDVTLDGSRAAAAFADRDAGRDKIVSVSGLALAGRDAANYTLSQPPARAAIAPRPVEPRVSAADKVYDGTTAAQLTGEALSGVLPEDAANVRLTTGAAAFDTKNAGAARPVTATGLALSGEASRNYTLASSFARTKASIAPRHVTGSFTVANKRYDGTSSAIVQTRSLEGALPGDAVRLSGGRARFADAAAGTGKAVTLEGARLTGPDSGNYILDSVAAATADITTPRKEPS